MHHCIIRREVIVSGSMKGQEICSQKGHHNTSMTVFKKNFKLDDEIQQGAGVHWILTYFPNTTPGTGKPKSASMSSSILNSLNSNEICVWVPRHGKECIDLDLLYSANRFESHKFGSSLSTAAGAVRPKFRGTSYCPWPISIGGTFRFCWWASPSNLNVRMIVHVFHSVL